MKNIVKSLTCLIAIVLSACSGRSSATFSSSFTDEPSSSSLDISSSSEISAPSSLDSSSSLPSASSSQPISSSSKRPSSSYYDGYYASLTSWSDGEDLKDQLYNIMRKGYNPLSYDTPNYETNILADHSKYDYEYLDVVYSDVDVYKKETMKGWQREHAFCASLMCGNTTGIAVKQKGRATDFHNLFASNASANSSRQNKNYGIANPRDITYQDRTTNNGYDGYSFTSTNFEPANKDKGRLARAIFYMATMYKEDEEDQVNGITMKGLQIVAKPVDYIQGDNCAFAIGNLNTLLAWSNTYIVDYLEMQHNISVYQDVNKIDGVAQGNRNPYVDFPGLVEYAFGSKKDQPGTLDDVTPAANYLNSEEHLLSHYALKEAKRSYEFGSKISNNDYKVVKVYKDYTIEYISSGYTHSLIDHVFSSSDGESIEAIITAGDSIISYYITLDPMANCSVGPIIISANGIDKKKPNVNQEVTYGGVSFLLNYQSSVDVSSSGMYIQNINEDGSSIGMTIGSSTKPLTKFSLTTKDSYLVDAAYIKAFVGNVNSAYSLTITVGETVLLEPTTVNNKDVAKIYGGDLLEPVLGPVSFVFSGTSSLKINTIAFNSIIV